MRLLLLVLSVSVCCCWPQSKPGHSPPPHRPRRSAAFMTAPTARPLQLLTRRFASVCSQHSGKALGTRGLKVGALRGGACGVRMSSTAAAVADAPVEKFRKDYTPPPYWIRNVFLDVSLGEDVSTVTATLTLERREGVAAGSELVLDGEDLELMSVAIDGSELSANDYSTATETLTLHSPPPSSTFELQTVVNIQPQNNLQLSGLYKSGGMFCTQCEAEGFRRITYFLDRPDVMASYKVRISADKTDYPILLSNGNKLEEGVEEGGQRHWAIWEDPWKKPSYLFALVAGNLGFISDTFTTASGKRVALNIYSEFANVGKLQHAMDSLKRAMKWDEEVYGLEYDLELYNIVAVNDFNMGAMENKGLNVFNTACVLADTKTATDADFERVEGVIAHEYFHNWSGNRVTCRDWFQLTLKEGFTVFRDQMYTADMTSQAVKRIEDVRMLRSRQFMEDASPMSHPIRPESYIAMDNFYTATVYEKGAEVIRMYHTLLGKDGFRAGSDLYFRRHDGNAVSCDDFRSAMADANKVDFAQFERWYTLSGTPGLRMEGAYDAAAKSYTLTLTQTPATAGAPPLHMPVVVGLLARDGTELLPSQVLELREEQQSFTFGGISEAPVLSPLRGFSAPVRLQVEQSDEDLAFLMARDTDSFNRWESGQKLATRTIMAVVAAMKEGKEAAVNPAFINSCKELLAELPSDLSLAAYALTLPDEGTLSQEMEVIDPIAVHDARGAVMKAVATELQPQLLQHYDRLQSATSSSGAVQMDSAAIGARRLKNVCLSYLCSLKTQQAVDLCVAQRSAAVCMSDSIGALASISNMDCPERPEALRSFREEAAEDPLVLNKWLAIQASSHLPDTAGQVKLLMEDPAFSLTNPNSVRALVASFARNPSKFHAPDGSGYGLVTDVIAKVCGFNPQMAAGLAKTLSDWRRYDETRGQLMRQALEKIMEGEAVPKDVYEIVKRSLD